MKKILFLLLFILVTCGFGFEAFDNFNRSDNQTLDTGNWIKPSSVFVMSIKDSCASSSPAAGTSLVAYWKTAFNRNQFSQFKIINVFDKTRPLRLLLHGQSSYSDIKTEAVIYQDSAVILVNNIRIDAVSETFPNATVVRFSAYGDSLYLHKDNNVVLTVYNNTNSSGYVGFGIHGYNDATNYHKIDDFLGGVYNLFDWDTIVGTPAEITQQPVDTTVNDLDTALFYVVATGANLTYQWYIDNVAISGATTDTFEFLATTKYHGSQVFCKLTTDTIISTDTAILTVNQIPPIHSGWPLELLTWNIDKAYPGVEYSYRLGIKGGEFPYRFYLRHGPTGMVVNAGTGELLWTPSGATVDSVRVTVKDSKNDSLVVQYNITATTTGFYFVDSANGDNGNAGTEASPWATMVYASTTADSSAYVYMKKGTYTTDAFNITATMCKRFLAYPGDTVLINSVSVGPNTINMGASGNSIFQGFNFDGNNRRYLFSIQGYIKNLIWRNNTIHNVGDGSAENPSGIFFWGGSENPITGGNSYDKVVVQDNLFYDINGSSIVSFDVKNMLFENNIVHTITFATGNSIADKDNGYMNTFRGNTLYGSPNGIVLMTQGGQSNIEICYNHIYGITIAPILVGLQPGYINDVFIHHNTVLGGVVYSGSIIDSSDSYNINTYKNIVSKNSNNVYSVSGGVNSLFFPDFRTKILIDSNIVSGNSDSTLVHSHWSSPTCNWAQWQDSGKDNNSLYLQLTYDTDSLPILPDSLLYTYGSLYLLDTGSTPVSTQIDSVFLLMKQNGVSEIGSDVYRLLLPQQGYRTFIENNLDNIVLEFSFQGDCPTARNVINFVNLQNGLRYADSVGFKPRITYMFTTSAAVPAWLSGGGYSDSTIKVILEEFIDSVFNKVITLHDGTDTLKNLISSMSLLNEIISSSNTATTPIQDHFWSQHIPQWWKVALEKAHSVAPNVELMWNENLVEYVDGEYKKSAFMPMFIDTMTADGSINLIDRIGFESHFFNDTNSVYSYARFKEQYNIVKSKVPNIPISITEFDLSNPKNSNQKTIDKRKAGRIAANFIKQCLDLGITQFYLWGWDSKESWINRTSYSTLWENPCWYDSLNTATQLFEPNVEYDIILDMLKSYSRSNPVSNEANRIIVKIDNTAISDSQPNFLYNINTHNIMLSHFWNTVLPDGSNVQITDSAGNNIPRVIDTLIASTRNGIINFNYTAVPDKPQYVYIKYGDGVTGTNDTSIYRLNDCFAKVSFKAGNVSNMAQTFLLDSIYNPTGTGLTFGYDRFGQYAHSDGTAYIGNKTNSTALQLDSGQIFLIVKYDSTNNVVNTPSFMAISDGLANAACMNQSSNYETWRYTNRNGVYISSTTTFWTRTERTLNDSLWHFSSFSWGNNRALSLNGAVATSNYDAYTGTWRIPGPATQFNIFTGRSRNVTNEMQKAYIADIVAFNKPKSVEYRSTYYNMMMDTSFFTFSTSLTIIQNPVSDTVLIGKRAHFNINATGSGTLTYRQYRNNILVDSNNTGIFTINTNKNDLGLDSLFFIVSDGTSSDTTNQVYLYVKGVTSILRKSTNFLKGIFRGIF